VAAFEQRPASFAAGQLLDLGCGIAGDDVQPMVAQLRVSLESDVMMSLVDRAF
jgi:hypothetical protein